MAESNLQNLYENPAFFGILTMEEAKTILREAFMKEEKRRPKRILFIHRDSVDDSDICSLSIYEAAVSKDEREQPEFEFTKNHCLYIQEFFSEETEIISEMVTRTFPLNLKELSKVKIATCEADLPYQPPLNLPNDDSNQTVSKEEMKRFIKLNEYFKSVMKCTATVCNDYH